jgi:methionyl-tRNA synthetase
MATKPKNNSSKSSTNKKVTSTKKTAKKPLARKKRKVKQKSTGKKNIFIILALLTIVAIVLGLFFPFESKEMTRTLGTETKEHYSTKKLLDDLAAIKVKTPIVKKVEAKKVEVEKNKILKPKPQVIKEKTLFNERGKMKKKS